MSEDLSRGPPRPPLSTAEILSLAREAIEKGEESRDLIRRNTEPVASDVQPALQHPGVTLDLCHKNIPAIPEELIDIIKDEIERLAISHNNVTVFPARFAECVRLRYLNARFNRLTEFPKPILQLSSIEILDLSRNRLRVLPSEISQMTALKVFAMQKNRIERLPVSMGDMNNLIVIKVDDNPLIFPPTEIWRDHPAAGRPGVGASEKQMLATAARIKKWLKQQSQKNNSQRTIGDSDEELSDNAETPRPVRPMGTRFPVKPSLSGIDTTTGPSTSPDPPPIPSKSHERMRSIQPQSRKGTLLSPPDSSVFSNQNDNQTNGDVTITRSKRHGMVTPRGPEGAAQARALSPSALQEAFSGVLSRPHSRTGSNVSTASIASENILATAKLIYTMASDMSKKLNEMRPMLEWQNQTRLKIQIENDIRTASGRIDILGRYLRRAQSQNSQPGTQRPTFLIRPVMDVLATISQFSRDMSQCSVPFCRASTYDAYRSTFWDVQKDTWDIHVSNTKMSEAIQSANHSRQTSTSSQYKQITYGDTIRPQISTAVFDIRNQPRNGLIPSPTGSNYSTVMHQSQNPSITTSFSPIPPGINHSEYTAPVPILNSDGSYMSNSRQEYDNDPLWTDIYQSFRLLCERANEGLPKIQKHYFGERQKAVRMYDQDHEAVRQLGSLVARSNGLVEVANRLTLKLDSVRPTDKSIRQSLEFWHLCRTIILEWTGYVDKTRALSAVPSSIHSEIKPVMKSIHVAVKDASARLTSSPWAHYLNSSNFPGVNDSFPPRNGTSGAHYSSMQTPILGSVPSTPLGAALGPAAVATVPSSRGPPSRGLSVFERADKLANYMPRQQEMLYGKKVS